MLKNTQNLNEIELYILEHTQDPNILHMLLSFHSKFESIGFVSNFLQKSMMVGTQVFRNERSSKITSMCERISFM